jgi:hypothetical protein
MVCRSFILSESTESESLALPDRSHTHPPNGERIYAASNYAACDKEKVALIGSTPMTLDHTTWRTFIRCSISRDDHPYLRE